MSGFGDVVTREAAWYTTDPCPTFVTAPAQLLHRTRSITDGITFASSNVASSATAAFTSADLGSTIGSSTSFASSATIVTITNASSVILSSSSTSGASSTGNQFVIDNGAPFDIVQGWFTKVPPRSRNLFITCEGEREDMVELYGHRESLYQMLITVQWSFEAGTGKLEDEQQNLHTAINKILLRLRGPLGDRTHNAQFISAAAGGPEGDGRINVRVLNSYNQVTAREPLGAEIRYTVGDWIQDSQ